MIFVLSCIVTGEQLDRTQLCNVELIEPYHSVRCGNRTGKYSDREEDAGAKELCCNTSILTAGAKRTWNIKWYYCKAAHCDLYLSP